MVPNAPHQGNLCLLNAVEFLKNGTYKSPEQISKKAEDKFNDTKVTFTTQINDEDVTFEVTSDPSNLKASNKLYPPFTQRPRRRHFPPLRQPLPVQNLRENIRRRKHREALEAMYARLTPVRGYVMKYSDVTLNETIKGWNTKLLNVGLLLTQIGRHQRHKDVMVKREFWEDMTRFLNNPR